MRECRVDNKYVDFKKRLSMGDLKLQNLVSEEESNIIIKKPPF